MLNEWLCEGRVLRDEVAQLLDLWVVHQRIEADSRPAADTRTSWVVLRLLLLLLRKLEQILWLSRCGSGRSGSGGCGWCCCRGVTTCAH